MEPDLLLLGVLHFLLPGRDLLKGATVEHIHFLRTQPNGRASRIHGHIAAAYHGHLAGVINGGGAAGLIRFHQVYPSQVLIGRVHLFQALAGNTHKPGQTGTGADIHRLKSIVKQIVNAHGATDHHIGNNLHTQRL